MRHWVEQLHVPGWAGVVEILVLAVVFYYLIRFFRGTRGAAVLSGLLLLLIALMVFTQWFNLNTLSWILQGFSVYLAVAFVVIFQPEIRRALAELGKQSVFNSGVAQREAVDDITKAVADLSSQKIGALIAIEREIGTRHIQESGTRMDSVVSPELLSSIFFPHTPLHDGGVIIKGDRILSAGCVFPLSQRIELSRSLGTRHRAAIGFTEETDAVVIVVSEETGTISVAYRGRLSRGVDQDRLHRIIASILARSQAVSKSSLSRVRDKLDLTPSGVAKTEAILSELAEEYER
jgi:diadenylate cyclase